MGNGRPDGIRPGSRPRRPRSARSRNVWLIAGITALATMVLAAGVIIGSHSGTQKTAPPAAVPGPGTIGAPPPAPAAPPPPAAVPGPGTIGAPPPAALAADFAQLETKLHAVA